MQTPSKARRYEEMRDNAMTAAAMCRSSARLHPGGSPVREALLEEARDWDAHELRLDRAARMTRHIERLS